MSNSNLPQEILFEIFLRLPTKSVGRCRCLSKIWHTQLSTTSFINSHLAHTKIRLEKERTNHLLVLRWSSLHIVKIHLKKVMFSNAIVSGNNLKMVVGSYNGLALLLEMEMYKYNMIVSNPITRQHVNIPNPTPTAETRQIYGFGYEPSSDDYKVVTISYYNDNGPGKFVDVYSLKKKNWKRVGELPFIPSNFIMPFVSGAVHWITQDDISNSNYRIDAFDLASETFHQVPIPNACRMEKLYEALVVLKGCLGVIFWEDDTVDVWVMKEYGVLNSWVMFSFNVSMMGDEMIRVCSLESSEILYVTTDGMDCFTFRNVNEEIIHLGLGSGSWSVFVESLVFPEQENVVAC